MMRKRIQRRGMILALLVKLKQLCNHPVLIEAKVKNSKKSDIIKTQYSGKLQRLTEMLDEVLAEGDRALIFTQFAEWGKVLQPYLEDYFNREILFLYGSTSKNKREEMIDRFQNDPQAPPIMILSLKAGGVGLNLTWRIMFSTLTDGGIQQWKIKRQIEFLELVKPEMYKYISLFVQEL